MAPSRSPLPTANPLQGGSRRYVVTERIARNSAGAGTGTPTARFQVWHPSVRMHAAMTLGWLPDVGEDLVSPAGINLALDAWGRCDPVRYGARPVRGNSIIPGPFTLPTLLPLVYEAVTGVDQWRGVVTFSTPNATGIAVAADLVCSVMWEPVGGATSISDDELAKIFQSCKVTPGLEARVFGG